MSNVNGNYRSNSIIGLLNENGKRRETSTPRPSAYDRTKAQVYATGNKWAIENFHATHD